MPLFVTRHNHLSAFGDGASVVAARPTNPARAHLRINQLTSSTFADWHRKLAEHADHFEVGWIETLFVGDQDLASETKR